MTYEINQTVTMKKAHPCGGNDWKIVRIGADVKLQCATCARFIILTRDELKKRTKAIAFAKAQKGE